MGSRRCNDEAAPTTLNHRIKRMLAEILARPADSLVPGVPQISYRKQYVSAWKSTTRKAAEIRGLKRRFSDRVSA